VELHAVEGPGFVADAHDFVFLGPSGDFEVGGDGSGADDEAVVAGGVEGVGQAGEDALVVVEDGGDFAVHEAPVAFHGAAPGEADALVAEADAEGGEFWAEVLEDGGGDAGFPGAAGSGGDDDMGGVEGFDFVDGGFVVSEDAHGAIGVHFANAVDEVVGEGVGIFVEVDHSGIIAGVSGGRNAGLGRRVPEKGEAGGWFWLSAVL
jgi:hypothetical protein